MHAIHLRWILLSLLMTQAAHAQVDIYGRPLFDGDRPNRWTVPGSAADIVPASTEQWSLAESEGFAFAPARIRYTGSWAEAVAIGDLSGDGRRDIAVSTSYYFDAINDYSVHLFRQGPDGALQPRERFSYEASQRANRNSIGILDLDGQNGLDLLVGGTSGLSVFLSTPAGGLSAPWLADGGQLAMELEIMDLNGDSAAEIVTLGWADGGRIYHPTRATGVFHAWPWNATVRGYNSMASGDLDGDGRADVAAVSGQGLGDNVHLYRNNGLGGLDLMKSLSAACDKSFRNAGGVGIGDVNGDRINDLVISGGGNGETACVLVYAGTEKGGLAAPLRLPALDIPGTVRVVDLNGNGRQDIVVAHGGWNAIGIYWQRPDGSLSPQQLVALPFTSSIEADGLAVGDFTGDGCNDIAVAGATTGLITLQGSGCRKPGQRIRF